MRHLNSGSKLGRNPWLARDAAEPGHKFVRARANHHHADARESGSSGGGENDHLGKRDTLQSRRQAASYIMTPASRKSSSARRTEVRGPRRRLYPHIPAGIRVGDGAKVAILELVSYELKRKEKKEKNQEEEPVEAASQK